MPYAYLDARTLIYQDYMDDSTGKMLVAEPGGSYSMSPVNGIRAIPPDDGRWAELAPPPPPAPPVTPVTVPAPEPAPAEPSTNDGGV